MRSIQGQPGLANASNLQQTVNFFVYDHPGFFCKTSGSNASGPGGGTTDVTSASQL